MVRGILNKFLRLRSMVFVLYEPLFENTAIPPNTADLATDEKAAVFGNGR